MWGRRHTVIAVSAFVFSLGCEAGATPLSPSGAEIVGLLRPGSASDEGPLAFTEKFLLMETLNAPPVWRRPNSLPCRQADGSNPCWDDRYIFDRAEAARQTSAEVVSRLQRDVAALRHVEDEICDGDVVSNSGARNGKAFFVPREGVAFDVAWLERQGLEHRILQDGRACIPSLSYGAWHFAHACGNAVQMLSRFDPAAADRKRPPATPMMAANAARIAPTASGGGFFGGGGLSGGGGSSGGVADLIPPAVIPDGAAGPSPAPAPPSNEGGPRPNPPLPGPLPQEPPAVVPAPPAIWMLLTGLAALAVGARRRTVAVREAA